MPNEHADGAEAEDIGKEIDPIHEAQTSSSLIGGSPTIHLMEPLWLGIGHEVIRFVIAPKMTEVVILGLSWLNKWGPYGGRRKEEEARERAFSPPTPTMRGLGEEAEWQRVGGAEHLKAISEQPSGIPLIPKDYRDLVHSVKSATSYSPAPLAYRLCYRDPARSKAS